MSTYTVRHNLTNECVEVDTDEEVVSSPIFDLHHTVYDAASWWEVAAMENAATMLAHGDARAARVQLNDLNMSLIGEDD